MGHFPGADLEALELASLGLVHDLRTPLSAAASAFHVLEALLGQGDNDTRFFRETVRMSLRRASQLVDEWQQVVTPDGRRQNSTQTTDLRWLCLDVLAELGLGNNTQVEIALDPLPVVNADAQKMRLVFRNLFTNALQCRRQGIPLRIAVGSQRSGAHHHVHVRDNGRGMSSLQCARIFEAFWRIPGTPGSGLGLGLHLVKRIIEAYGGRVWATSRRGAGTTIHFTISSAS